jgi:TorA maturation chaperone TorD
MTLAEHVVRQEKDRCIVYRKLADLYRPADRDMPHAMEALIASLTQLESNALPAAVQLRQAYAEVEDPVCLQVDFARLFAGPFLMLAPPYGSVYLDDKRIIMGDSTMDVQRRYRELGLEIAADFKEAPDHIAAELEFMHALIGRGAEAAVAEDIEVLTDSLLHQKRFLERHLSGWVPQFTARIAEHAESEVYRRLSEVTDQFIAEEVETIAALDLEPAPSPSE